MRPSAWIQQINALIQAELRGVVTLSEAPAVEVADWLDVAGLLNRCSIETWLTVEEPARRSSRPYLDVRVLIRPLTHARSSARATRREHACP
jgi:hypothetical protein